MIYGYLDSGYSFDEQGAPGAEVSQILSERRPTVVMDSIGGQFLPVSYPFAQTTHVHYGSGKAGAPGSCKPIDHWDDPFR